MDLVILLELAVKTLAALIIFFIALLIITGWRREKPKAPPLAKRAVCEGVRNGAPCGKPVYRCSNCRESGCELNGCKRRQFEAPGKCISCGYPNTMQRL
jgi:hypothetical protein